MTYYIVEFILITVISYLVYYNLFMKRNEQKNKKPIEFAYLETKYKLRLNMINLRRLSKLIAICNSLIIATTVIAIDFTDIIALQLVVGFGLLMSLIVITYYFIGLYFKKKGLTKVSLTINK